MNFAYFPGLWLHHRWSFCKQDQKIRITFQTLFCVQRLGNIWHVCAVISCWRPLHNERPAYQKHTHYARTMSGEITFEKDNQIMGAL